MAENFHRITQSLRRDSGLTSTTAAFVGVSLLIAWGVWAFKARVTRYESSDAARLEVSTSAYPVQANITGEMKSSYLVLGREVHAGDVLAELDSSTETLNLDEERSRWASFGPEIAALRARMESEQAGSGDEKNVLSVAKQQAMAQISQAEAQAQQAETEARRAESLRAAGIIATSEAERTAADARSKRAAANALKLAALQLEPQLRVRQRDREVRLNQLLQEQSKLEAERATSEAAIRKLEHAVEYRRIRAPISGRLAECATLRPGSHIAEGQQLGVILPAGAVEIIAEFSPSAAMGKIHRGQPATLRLDGFPWAQYGTVPARVSQVASEIRDGKVRVELAVTGSPNSALSLQHGAPGKVEIETEITSPAALLFRSAGALVGAQ
ncbi:MAG TPA: HlyD family efflux transporter periplasmic adaptor subunit [Bryobacteraceae bacterium]|jgi:membrane fusion protein (multidrug efflux system)|nr:HlyD family efflux transporter periplasmic adaptor subunit [Bryobacteraceae bacterium]